MVLLAIIVLILKSPFLILQYLFQHKLVFIGVVIVGVAFIAVSSLSKSDDSPQVQIPEYQKIAPDISKAPVVINTPSRVYYVSGWVDNGQIVTLESFYFYDREEWEASELPLPLDRNTVGEIKIYQR